MRKSLALALLCLAFAGAAAAEKRIKLASFVPEGSIWDKNLRLMGEEWKRETEGRVSLKVFAGGQQGEEPTVVSKMRLGVLQAKVTNRHALEVVASLPGLDEDQPARRSHDGDRQTREAGS